MRAGRAILFVQRALRKVRELAYVFEDDGFRAPDLTLVSEHISRSGIVEMTYQTEPQSLLWCTLTDGTLICLTYERDQKVVGWSRHVLGGQSDAGTAQTKVESVAVIPNTNGTADELYIVVQRYINGATRRYIEYLKPHWEESNDPEDAFFVDCGLSLDVPLTITAATARSSPGGLMLGVATSSQRKPINSSRRASRNERTCSCFECFSIYSTKK